MSKKSNGARPHRTVTITKKMVIEGTTDIDGWCSPCSEGLRRFRPITISTDPEAACNIRLALRIAEDDHDDDRAADMQWGLGHWCDARLPLTVRGIDDNAEWWGADPMQIQQLLAALADHLLTARGR
jgi:hypothetical protein